MDALTHFDKNGNAIMVDVTEKPETSRKAIASGIIRVSDEVYNAITDGTAPKGDVLATARIAGIMAAKKTSEIIPLCHPLPITKCSVAIAMLKVTGRTGVEMEALHAVTVALLTIYDMCKAIDKTMRIEDVHLCYKEGGKSGIFRNE